jgi:hypothetical protein
MHALNAVLEPLGHGPPMGGVAGGTGQEQQPGGRIQRRRSTPMRRHFHLALGVADLAASIADCSTRLGMEPEAAALETSLDVNGILWERFSCVAQRQEIESLWGAAASFRASDTDPAC